MWLEVVLDRLDNNILAALSADSSTSTALLARRFGVARSTVQARIERLKRNGTIARFTLKLGDVALARRIKATVLLRVEARATPSVVQRIKMIPEVEMVHSTSGRFDLILQVASETTHALDGVLDRIGAIEGVQGSESLIHLSTKLDRAV